MTIHLVKLNNKFYITDNPNRLGNEVNIECSDNGNGNDWCVEMLKHGNDDLKILIESKGALKRPPGETLTIDRVIDISVIRK